MLKIDAEMQSLIPPLSTDERATLEANIVEAGCRDALVVWQEEGILLDGHNRFDICNRNGIPFDTREISLPDIGAAKVWMIDNQRGRRNLSDGWKYELAQTKKAILAAQGKAKQAHGATAPGKTLLSTIDKSVVHNTRDEIAADLGWSTGKVAMADKVWKNAAPEVKEKVKSGDTSINQAFKEIEKLARKKEQIAEHLAKFSQPEPIADSGLFQLVLADPPWRYDHQEAANRAIENQYPTADIETIKTHIPRTEKDAILFLWATAPKLTEAMDVMAAWGFRYVTNAVWDKQKIGMGYWFRGQHELLLVGVKGKPGTVPECERRSSVFSEARGKHSAKPVCVYEWIERAFPDRTKLEMYCRTPRKNWAAWGNQV